MSLSKEAILTTSDLHTEEVDVPEWGGTVKVRSMTGAERDEYEQSMVQVGADGQRSASLENYRAKLVAMCMVDDSGSRMFTGKEAALLAGKNAAALDRVFQVAQRINGLGSAELEAAAKN